MVVLIGQNIVITTITVQRRTIDIRLHNVMGFTDARLARGYFFAEIARRKPIVQEEHLTSGSCANRADVLASCRLLPQSPPRTTRHLPFGGPVGFLEIVDS